MITSEKINTPEKRFKLIFEEFGFSRLKISKDLGISASSLSFFFSGKHKIRKVLALAIQASYNVNADWILYNKQPKFLKVYNKDIDEEVLKLLVEYENFSKPLKEVFTTVLEGLNKIQNSKNTK